MSNLLKEALADAKAVKKTALLNAKAVIEETFQPNLQRMISAKLAEEEGDEEELDIDLNFGAEDEMEDAPETGFGSFEDEGEEEMPPAEDDAELEELLRELDGEEDEFAMEEGEGEDDFMVDEMDEFSDDEEVAMEGDEMPTDDEIYEMIVREMEGEDDEEIAPEPTMESRKIRSENAKLKKQLREALNVVSSLKGTINEVNLLNAKLMFNTKVSRQYDLDKKQKTTVLEALDRASNIREVKLVYSTIMESLAKTSKMQKKTGLKEGYASKSTPTIMPKKTEQFNFVPRWQELANINKK